MALFGFCIKSKSIVGKIASFNSFMVQAENNGVNNVDDIIKSGLGNFSVIDGGKKNDSIVVKYSDYINKEIIVYKNKVYCRDQSGDLTSR